VQETSVYVSAFIKHHYVVIIIAEVHDKNTTDKNIQNTTKTCSK